MTDHYATVRVDVDNDDGTRESTTWRVSGSRLGWRDAVARALGRLNHLMTVLPSDDELLPELHAAWRYLSTLPDNAFTERRFGLVAVGVHEQVRPDD